MAEDLEQQVALAVTMKNNEDNKVKAGELGDQGNEGHQAEPPILDVVDQLVKAAEEYAAEQYDMVATCDTLKLNCRVLKRKLRLTKKLLMSYGNNKMLYQDYKEEVSSDEEKGKEGWEARWKSGCLILLSI